MDIYPHFPFHPTNPPNDSVSPFLELLTILFYTLLQLSNAVHYSLSSASCDQPDQTPIHKALLNPFHYS